MHLSINVICNLVLLQTANISSKKDALQSTGTDHGGWKMLLFLSKEDHKEAVGGLFFLLLNNI